MVAHRERAALICARVAPDAPALGRSASPLASARRSERPKHRRASLRASVSSDRRAQMERGATRRVVRRHTNDRLIVSLGCHRTPSAVWDGAPACATIVTGSGRLGSQGLVSPGSTGRMGRPTARTRPVPARYTRRNWIRAGRCRGPCGVPQSPRRVAPAFAGRCRGRSGPRRRSGRS